MTDEYKTVVVTYSVGYGDHTAELDVPLNATEDEINDEVSDFVHERLAWSWEFVK